MADGMAFGLNDPCRDYFTCIGQGFVQDSLMILGLSVRGSLA